MGFGVSCRLNGQVPVDNSPVVKQRTSLMRGKRLQRLLDRDPVAGRDLASQPTLSRFENAVGTRELYRMAELLALRVIERHTERLRGRVRRTIDLDPAEDSTHGAQ